MNFEQKPSYGEMHHELPAQGFPAEYEPTDRTEAIVTLASLYMETEKTH
jgi:hypothetical protein